ncbi:MAG: adenylyltransferase/cytidyltransferase family protein [Mycoplasmataceae bacterium]|nr:adenylyltransferase/cytidyltransferase family protein [Mycoplasmataceae bacterium]
MKNNKPNPVIGITYGTYDLFHIGHKRLLRRIKKYCDVLIVYASSDEFNLIKGKKSFDNFEIRKRNLLNSNYVDEVYKEEKWDQKKQDILRHNINIFIMGSDWKGKFDDLNEYCEVKYLKRTPFISSTKLKKKITKKNEKNKL